MNIISSLMEIRNKKWYLLLSTLALMCLSLTVHWRNSIGLGIIWILCYVVTVYKHKRTGVFTDYPHSGACSWLAVFGLLMLCFTFYYELSVAKPLTILVSIGIPASIVPSFVLTLAVIGALVGHHAFSIYAQYLIDLLIPIADILKKMYKQYFALSAIYICGLLAIIRANFYYIDDLGRGVLGYTVVGNFSRYAAHALSMFVHGNGYLTDISPLPQILAALIMALAAVITLYLISERTDFRLLDVVCMVPFGLFPYFLECLSYKYDAPYMALSVLAAVCPLLLHKQSSLKYILASAVGIVLVCTTYQASAGIFPSCVAFLCFLRWNRGEDIRETFKFLFKSIAGFALGILFFRLILMEPLSDGFYASSSVDLLALPSNMVDFIGRILGDFNSIWLFLFFVVITSFIVIGCTSSNRKKVPALLMGIFTFFVLFVFSYSLYGFLRKPITYPRSMYGFGILLSLLSYYIMTNSKALFPRVCTLLLAWFVFTFSFTYGNALSAQKDYADFRITQVLSDLGNQDMMATDEQIQFSVTGTIGFSESVQNMLPAYPVLEDLVQTQFSDNSFVWNAYRLQHYYGIKNLSQTMVQNIQSQPGMVLLSDSLYHTIYGNGKCLLIELK